MVGQNTVVFGAVAGAAAVAAGYDMYQKAQLKKVRLICLPYISIMLILCLTNDQAKDEAERKEDEIQAEKLQRMQVDKILVKTICLITHNYIIRDCFL
jgi:hypothetical protein